MLVDKNFKKVIESRYHSLNGAKPESHTMGNQLMSKTGADVKQKNYMKRFSIYATIIALIVISIGFISCYKTEIEAVSVSESFICGVQGKTFDVSVKSDINVSLDNSYEWITITKTGEKKNQVFHFTVLENETASLRNATINYNRTEKNKTVSVSISIVQSGKTE